MYGLFGQRRHEQARGDGAPIRAGGDGRDEEHHAHEHDDGREDNLDHLVRANPHGDERQNTQNDDDRDHRHVGKHGLDAQDAARDVARLVRDVAHEDGDDNNHDRNPHKRLVGNTIADVFTQTLARNDADARRHLLEDDGGHRGEQQRPQHGVAVARA